MNEFCLACGGELLHLGKLGNCEHFRCRDCGLDTSVEIAPPPVKATRVQSCVWGRCNGERIGDGACNRCGSRGAR